MLRGFPPRYRIATSAQIRREVAADLSACLDNMIKADLDGAAVLCDALTQKLSQEGDHLSEQELSNAPERILRSIWATLDTLDKTEPNNTSARLILDFSTTPHTTCHVVSGTPTEDKHSLHDLLACHFDIIGCFESPIADRLAFVTIKALEEGRYVFPRFEPEIPNLQNLGLRTYKKTPLQAFPS